MLFEKFKPSKEYAHLITYFWTLKSSESDLENVKYRFVPDTYVDWVFHLGAPWQCDFPDSGSQTKTSKFHAFGQIKKHLDLSLPKDSLNIFGVKFYPWVSNKIWKVDMHYLTNTCLDLMHLELPKMQILQEKICLASTVKQRIQLVENYLSPFLSYNNHESLKPLLVELENNQSLHTIKKYVGIRRLQQRFKNEIGISPKLFLRTVRINAVINEMKLKPKQSLTQVALNYNYFDQAHFIKDFKHFTGINPKLFLKSISPDGDILNLKVD